MTRLLTFALLCACSSSGGESGGEPPLQSTGGVGGSISSSGGAGGTSAAGSASSSGGSGRAGSSGEGGEGLGGEGSGGASGGASEAGSGGTGSGAGGSSGSSGGKGGSSGGSSGSSGASGSGGTGGSSSTDVCDAPGPNVTDCTGDCVAYDGTKPSSCSGTCGFTGADGHYAGGSTCSTCGTASVNGSGGITVVLDGSPRACGTHYDFNVLGNTCARFTRSEAHARFAVGVGAPVNDQCLIVANFDPQPLTVRVSGLDSITKEAWLRAEGGTLSGDECSLSCP